MNKLTLQINSLEALERLIGGDTETEIEIRNSVVQKFAEKHLKPIVNSAPITDVIRRIKDHAYKHIQETCANEIATFKSSYGGSAYDIKLRPEIELTIKNKVQDSISKIISEKVKAAFDEYYTEARITKRINLLMDDNINALVNEKVKEKIDSIKASL
jgi:phosphoribosylformylglycinamidine (FGAM) synthase PurS component